MMPIEYEISEQDFVDAHKLAIKKHPNSRTRLILLIVPYWGLLLFLAVVWNVLQSGIRWDSGLVVTFALGLFGLASPWLVKQSVKKSYRKTASMHSPRTLLVDDTGLSFSSSDFSSQLKWPFFVKFAEDDKSFVLYQSNQIFHPIPKRQLTPEQISELRDVFTQHITTQK
jgi:hypothetical protein